MKENNLMESDMKLQKCGVCGREIQPNWPRMETQDSGVICMQCEGVEPKKDMYFKVYSNRESCGNNDLFYVDTKEGIEKCLEFWWEAHEEVGADMPVIEPVLLTEYRFNNLPEFEGF